MKEKQKVKREIDWVKEMKAEEKKNTGIILEKKKMIRREGRPKGRKIGMEDESTWRERGRRALKYEGKIRKRGRWREMIKEC